MNTWIFDLDGVVTSIEEKTITNPHIVEYIASFLQNGDLVTINTGRSLAFIRREVLTPLLAYIKENQLSEALLHSVFTVGEKGMAWIEDGKDVYDLTMIPPKEFFEKTKHVIETHFSDTMTFDETKQTMISTEFSTGTSLETYKLEQKELVSIFEKMLQEEGLEDRFKLDPNISAVDIEAKNAGKALGTQRILTWLTKRDLNPNKFIAFGDSAADLGTGEALQNNGKDFTFVFVGNPNIITKHPSFPIVFTKDLYDKGVIEYLSLDPFDHAQGQY